MTYDTLCSLIAIPVKNYGANCKKWRCSCHHKQCKALSKDYPGALKEFNYIYKKT